MRNPDPGRGLRAGAADRAHDALAPREPVEPVARAPRDPSRPHPIGDRLHAVAPERPAARPGVAGARAGTPGPGVFAPSSCPDGSAASLEATRRRLHGSEPARQPPRRQSWSAKAMFLNALGYDAAAKSIIKSRAEPSRAEPSRAEPSRAPSSRLPGRVMPRLSGGRSGRPPDSRPSAPSGAQSDPLPTDPLGTAPPSRRREPTAGVRRRAVAGALAFVLLGFAALLATPQAAHAQVVKEIWSATLTTGASSTAPTVGLRLRAPRRHCRKSKSSLNFGSRGESDSTCVV